MKKKETFNCHFYEFKAKRQESFQKHMIEVHDGQNPFKCDMYL